MPEALRTLERLEALHPQYARLFQDPGHCYRSLGSTAAAIAAYQRAVALNEALPASWKALQELLPAAGRDAEAEHARALGEYLARLPPAIISASSLFAEGEVLGAEQIVRQFLQTQPDHIEGMRLLGRIGMKLDVLDDAEFLLESVLVFAPDYHAARYDYARVLSLRHQHGKAVEEARKLLAIEPQHRGYRTIYATASVGVGDYVTALRVFRELAAETPQAPDIHLSIAHT